MISETQQLIFILFFELGFVLTITYHIIKKTNYKRGLSWNEYKS